MTIMMLLLLFMMIIITTTIMYYLPLTTTTPVARTDKFSPLGTDILTMQVYLWVPTRGPLTVRSLVLKGIVILVLDIKIEFPLSLIAVASSCHWNIFSSITPSGAVAEHLRLNTFNGGTSRILVVSGIIVAVKVGAGIQKQNNLQKVWCL